MEEAEKKTVGYVLNFIMDYGNGRQVQITGNLPLGASKEDFDAELDKLRQATDRQKAWVMLRENEAKLKAETMMVKSLEAMMQATDKEAEAAIQEISTGPNANHTKIKQQIDNFRMQARDRKSQKHEELQRHKTNAEIAEITVSSLKKEIEG